MRKQPHINELGFDERGVSHDEPAAPRLTLQLVTDKEPAKVGDMPAAVVADVSAAIDQEDQQTSEEELNLFLKRYAMEKAISAAEKERLIREMASIIMKIYDALALPESDPYHATVHTARMLTRFPNMPLDTLCFSSASYRKTGQFSAIPSEADVRAWKP